MTALAEASQARPGAVADRPRLTVLIAVPAGTLRDLVIRRLARLGDSDVTGAASVAEARTARSASSPRALCVAASALPDGTGTALLGELRAAGRRRGLLLAAAGDAFAVRAAIAAGVRSYLVMPQQRGAASSAVAGSIERSPVDVLSQRESEVLGLVAGGRSNRDIGVALGLSALTVKSHLARIGRKLNTGDRAEMVAIALRVGIIE